jgi:energy-coupling factor transporter transmembrane protein EcfT
MQYVWSLITLVSLVFSFSAVYQWIRLTSLFILIVFWAQKAPKYFILNVLKHSSILAYGPTGGGQKNVAY